MKKNIAFALLIIFIFVTGFVAKPAFSLEPLTVAGGEEEPSQLQVEPNADTTPVTQKVDYTLPYPGILPDHPLYFLKRLRDSILEKLIADPVRKAEFYILQGDKRLQMGSFLFEMGKGTLAESTISKAEKYLDQAVNGLSSYKQGGSVVPPYVVERLEKATAKHKEVIGELMAKANETEKAGLQGSLNFLNQLIEKLAPLR